jgi:hypothetical protein
MIGGQPIFLAPGYAQGRPYPVAGGWGTGIPQARPANPGYAAVQPTTWTAAPGARQVPTYPIVRGQMPDEPARTSTVHIPTPEELGIGRSSPFDWNGLESRLRQLRAICYDREKTPQGCWRLTCVLPGRSAGQNHRIEARADSEAEASRLLVVKAQEWVAGRN